MAHYRELSPLLNGIIGGRFVRNKNLQRLLTEYEPNEENFQFDSPNDLIMKRIYPMPKMPDIKTDKGAYICAYFNGGVEKEKKNRNRNILFKG